MADADDGEDLEAIRQRKREELLEGTTAEGAPEDPLHVTGADHLADITAEHDVVLVDFYADWCGPCKMLEPTVETIAAETAATVAKVDIDAHQDIAAQYQVQGIPTLALFSNGETVERLVGVQDEATLRGLVDQYS